MHRPPPHPRNAQLHSPPPQNIPQVVDPLPAANPFAARDAAFAAAIRQPATLAWPSPRSPLPLRLCATCGEAFTGAAEHGEASWECVRYASPEVAHGARCTCNSYASTQANCGLCHPIPYREPWPRPASSLTTISLHQSQPDSLPCVLAALSPTDGGDQQDPLILVMICQLPRPSHAPIVRPAYHASEQQDIFLRGLLVPYP